MKPKLGIFVTALFRATLTFRPTVIIAAVCIVLTWPTSRNGRSDERGARIVVLSDSLTAG
jgi:hypothetical protein